MANSNHQNNESEEIRDTIVEVLTSINHRPSITEIIAVLETQDNDRMNSFLVNNPSQQRRVIINIAKNMTKSTKHNKKNRKF